MFIKIFHWWTPIKFKHLKKKTKKKSKQDPFGHNLERYSKNHECFCKWKVSVFNYFIRLLTFQIQILILSLWIIGWKQFLKQNLQWKKQTNINILLIKISSSITGYIPGSCKDIKKKIFVHYIINSKQLCIQIVPCWPHTHNILDIIYLQFKHFLSCIIKLCFMLDT